MSRRLAINKTWDGKPSVAAPYKAVFSINAMTGDVVVNIDAPFFNDPPPPIEPGKYKKLHEYEVVEIFLAAYPADDDDAAFSPYIEIQVGPHGHYNLAFFLQEGDFQNMDTSLTLEQPPVPKVNNKTGRWSVEVGVPSFFLPEPVCGDDLSITWMVNAYAIHGIGEQREYLAHSPVPGVNPNFHQLRRFVPLVLFETMETRQTIDRSSMAIERIRQSSIAGGYQYSPSTGAAMGLASAAGQTHDLTRRLLQDVADTPGGLKGVVGEDEGDNSSGINLLLPRIINYFSYTYAYALLFARTLLKCVVCFCAQMRVKVLHLLFFVQTSKATQKPMTIPICKKLLLGKLKR